MHTHSTSENLNIYTLYLGLCLTLIALLVKISADDILKYFSNFFQKIGFNISCKLSP